MATSPDELEISALTAVKNAPDVETGYNWLTQEYQSQQWEDPARAKEILTQYGTTLRQKFNKNNVAGLGDVSDELPFSRATLPDSNLTDPTERRIEKENLWEQANLKMLEVTDDPNLLLKRQLLEEYIPAAASLQRRVLKDPGVLKDTAARVALGVISPITSLFGTGEPSFLKEATNPERDDDFMSELISGAGTVGTAIGLTAATGGAVGLAYLGAGAAGSIKETYQGTKENTGSTERALASASIDAAGQAAGFALGGRVAGKVGAKFAQALGASTDVLAQGGTEVAAKTAFRQVMETAGEQAAANVAMTQGRRSAARVGETGEAGAAIPTGEDVVVAGRAAAVGGILGAGASGLGQGYEALQQRSAARQTAVAEVAPAQEPVVTTPESREAALVDPQGLTNAALDQASAALPNIDSEGVAHAQEEQVVHRTPASELQQRPTDEASSVATGANGDTFHIYPDGVIMQTKASEGQIAAPDVTVGVSQDIAKRLLALKNSKAQDGESPKLYWDGSDLFIKSNFVTEDLDLADVPTGSSFAKVPFSRELNVGDVPVQVSLPLAGGEKTRYSSNIGPTIADIQPGKNAFAPPPEEAQPTGPGSKPRMVAQRIVENPNLPKPIRDAFVTTNAKGERETTLRYIEQPMTDTRNEGAMWIQKLGGDDEATNAYLSGPDQVSREVSSGAQQLFKRLSRGVVNAEKAGDSVSAMKLTNLASAVQVKLARASTEGGQIINQLKDLQTIDPDEAVAFRTSQLRSKLLEGELTKEGLTPDDAAKEPARIQQIKDQIAEIEKQEPSAQKDALKKQLQKESEQIQKKIDKRLEAAQKRLNIKFPPDVRARYRDLLAARTEVPLGSSDQKAIDADLATIENKLSKSTGERVLQGWRSYYILNLLADVGTGTATAVGNIANLGIGSTAAVAGGVFRGESIADIPQNFEQFSRIAAKSFPKAFRNAFNDFMGGYFAKYEEGDFVRNGPPIIRNLGYVGRFLSALDTFAGELGGDAATAIRLMEENPGLRNLKGAELADRLDEALYGTKTFREQAQREAQVRVERLEKLGIKADANVIADEIYRNQRPENIQEEIEGWKRKIALRNTQGGTIGIIGKSLSDLRRIPFAGPAFINFVKAAGNLIAFKVELTPYGFLRPTLLEKVHGQKLSPLEKSQMYTSAIVGSVIAAGAYSLMQSGKVQVHGNGPSNPAEKKRLMESGWKPFSIQVGDKFISYAEMPFSTILAGVGGYGDYQKYSVAKNKIGEEEAANYIMGASFSSLFASPLTQNASELIEILKQGDQGGDIVGRLENFAKRSVAEAAKNAIIPGNRTLRNVTAMFQDPLETRLSWQASILSGIPGASKAGKPSLNLFGEPILEGKSAAERYRSISRFYTQQVNDPAIRFLTDKGYYITDLPGKVTIPDENFRALKARRKELMGTDFEDVLTESERYAVQAQSGPDIKRLVLQYRTQYGNSTWNEQIQKKLSEDVSKIRSMYKRKVLYEGANRGFNAD